MIVWPISGAAPVEPRNVRPPITIPPPTPVPTVNITTMSAIGRISSSCASASAATVASLSTNVGMPRHSVSACRSGTPCSGMLTDDRAVPVAKSMTDGTPMPTAVARPWAWTACTSCSTSASELDRSVGVIWGSDSAPSSSTATETFVPPTSTPISRWAIAAGHYPSGDVGPVDGGQSGRSGSYRSLTTIPAPPKTPSQVGRAAQDLGLAGLLGGTLFGRMALHPAVASISDPRERGEVVEAARRRYGTGDSLALGAVVSGGAGARAAEAADRNLAPAERRLARVKDGLVGALVLSGVASAGEGVRFGRSAPGGAVPLEDGSHAAPDASGAATRLKQRLNALGAVTMAAEVGLVAVNAALAQENFRRPAVRRRVRLR